MKDHKDNKDDLVVDIDDKQLALPVDKPDDLIVETAPKGEPKAEDAKTETEPRRERKRHNQDAIDALKAQIEARDAEIAREKQARLEAEDRARKREAELHQARGRVAESEYDRAQGLLTAAKAKESEIKRALKSASELGEHDKIADLQAELAGVAARKLQYEDYARDLERRAQAAAQEEKPRDEPRRQEVEKPANTFDAAISGLSHKSQAWLRQHPECVTDETQNAKVMWAHKDAMKKGLRVDSPEYFEHIEDLMGFAQADADEDEIEVEAPRSDGRRGMPSAPVSRDARMGQVAPGKYRLTREEADMAEQLGMTPTEYATNKLKAIKDGRYAN